MKNSLLTLAVLLGSSSILSAVVIHIDVGRLQTGNTTTTLGYNNIGFNGSAGITNVTIDLTDDTGSDSGYDLNFTTNGQSTSYGPNGNYSGAVPAAISSQPSTALSDGLNFTNINLVPELTFSSLSSSFTYEVLIYSARTNQDGFFTYTLTDGNGSQSDTLDVRNNSTDVVLFSGLVPDGSGEISFTFSESATDDRGGLNYVRLTSTAIPEPSAALLFGLGSLALLRRRKLS